MRFRREHRVKEIVLAMGSILDVGATRYSRESVPLPRRVRLASQDQRNLQRDLEAVGGDLRQALAKRGVASGL